MKISDGKVLSELEIRCLLIEAEKMLNEYGVYHSANHELWLEVRDWLTASPRRVPAVHIVKKYLTILSKQIILDTEGEKR